jgi:polyisoprenoid-binding protein YceI
MMLAVAVVAMTLVAMARPAHAADTWEVDPAHTSVMFKIRHFNVSWVWGRFDKLSGTVSLDSADAGKSSFDLSVDTASVNTGVDARDAHLRKPDFFHAEKFPAITFKSTTVAKSADGYDVTGDLTLLGVTKPVTVQIAQTGPLNDPKGNPRAGFDTTFTVKRSDFGMKYGLGPIGDEVTLTISFEVVPPKKAE